MLASLLPGLRDLRTPLAVGYVWLLNGWILFGDQLEQLDLSRHSSLERVDRLHDALGLSVSLAALSFAAFLLGSLVTFSTNNVGLIPRYLPSSIGKWIRSIWDQSGTALELERFIDRRRPDLVGESLGLLPVGELRARLLVANQDLYGEYDRLDAEATFRINISLPIAALGLILRSTSVWLMLALLVASAILMFRGVVQRETAQTVLMRAVIAGVIEHPLVAELSQKASPPRSESPDPD